MTISSIINILGINDTVNNKKDMDRDYQRTLIDALPGHGNTCVSLATGGGKTHMFTTYIKELNAPTCAMAHRNELVGQMSLALSARQIPHRIIASDDSIQQIVKAQRRKFKKCFYDPSARVICASVDTLVRRDNSKLFNSIKLWVGDEAHHFLKANKWGRAVDLFPNAIGLGVTATPMRADGKGLSRHTHGIFDRLIEGPNGDELIERGYLSPYDIVSAPLEGDGWEELENHIGSTGDYKHNQLAKVTKQNRSLTGNVIDMYLKWARGKLGITFAVDIEHAEDITQRYRAAGVNAQTVTSKTPFLKRVSIMEDFVRRRITMLVNVDLFGEGVDVPGVEVVIMARKTASFPLYSQQAGRTFRPVYCPGMPLDTDRQRRLAIAAGPKPVALIIDLAENWKRHLLPTADKVWPFDGGEKRGSRNTETEHKLRSCLNPECGRPFRAILDQCPRCGWAPEKSTCGAPEEVDGDLERINIDRLRELQKEAKKITDPARVPAGVSKAAAVAIIKNHHTRSLAQRTLRDAISQWAGWAAHREGLSLSEIRRLFYLKFKTDVLTAQTLGAGDAEKLETEVRHAIKTYERNHSAGHGAGAVLVTDGRHSVAQ